MAWAMDARFVLSSDHYQPRQLDFVPNAIRLVSCFGYAAGHWTLHPSPHEPRLDNIPVPGDMI